MSMQSLLLLDPSDCMLGGLRNDEACAYAEMRKSEATSTTRQSSVRQGFASRSFLDRPRFSWFHVGLTFVEWVKKGVDRGKLNW